MSDQEEIRIRIEGSGERALLLLPGGTLPPDTDAESLVAVTRASGIAITQRVTDRLTQLYLELAERPTSEPLLIAEAEPPVDGEDGRLEWRDRFDPNRDDCATAPSDTDAADDRVDHYSTISYLRVEEGEEIATLHPPIEGMDGCDVVGQSIPARAGRPVPVNIDSKSIRMESDGRLIAIHSGVLRRDSRSLSVVQILEIPGYVDFSVGHVDFDGSVEIREGVRDRFQVRATKDVTVGGLIEAASIVCGGNLACPRGVAARDRAMIVVRGNVQAGFLNNARGRIAGDLEIRRELMNCELAIGGHVRGDSACVIGGTLILTRGMSVAEIGSEAHAPTTIRLGEMPMLSREIRSLEEQIDRLEEHHRKLIADQKMISGRRNAIASERERLTELMFEVDEAHQELLLARKRRRELLDRVRLLSGVQVRIQKMLWGNTTFVIDGRPHRIRDDVRGPVTISWNARRDLVFRLGEGENRPLTDLASIGEYRAA